MNRTRWTLLPELSTFVNWQRVRLQENSTEIPPGSMPRTLDVILRNDQVERAKPGDKCTFTGSLIVVPDVGQMALPGTRMEATEGMGRSRQAGGPQQQEGVGGLKQLGVRELTYKLAFLSCMVQPTHNQANSTIRLQQSAGDEEESPDGEEDPAVIFTAAELEDIHRMRNTPQLYQQLVESIAPSIYGHAEIKTGILLMLFGGVHKRTPEGINLRGDINVCIVGDPGTAKSQLLRYVVGFLPRSVYTSGKATSAAGLTASVLKDEETGEFTIEAGALMLADNGICAIDEFDKMDLVDQVAIHEAMEQQTISISKAGIQATLNARTSILAAANPIGGRYDRRKTLRQNIAMTAPIMSRFDLFFVVLDEGDERTDYNIARHLLSIHRHREQAVSPPFAPEQLARYLRYARCLKPQLTAEACELLVSQYKLLRQNDVTGSGSSYRMTVRQLESMIRLSEAMARLNCDAEVRPQYVRDACRLLKSSIIRVETENIDLETTEREWRQTMEEAQPPTGNLPQAHGENTATTAKLSMRYEDYVRISNMLVYQLRHVEQLQASTEEAGLTKGALIDWFLEQIEEELTTEAMYLQRRREVAAVIERLVHKDGVLIELRGAGDNAISEEEIMVVVHPNYSIA